MAGSHQVKHFQWIPVTLIVGGRDGWGGDFNVRGLLSHHFPFSFKRVFFGDPQVKESTGISFRFVRIERKEMINLWSKTIINE